MKLAPAVRPALAIALFTMAAPACTKNALTKPTPDAATDTPATTDLSPIEAAVAPDAWPPGELDSSTPADLPVVQRPDVPVLVDTSIDSTPDSPQPIDQTTDSPFAVGETGDVGTYRSETATSEPAPVAPLTITPDEVYLGNVPIGRAASILTFTITAKSAITDLSVGLRGDDVTLAPNSTCGETLAAGESCVVVVEFVATDRYNRVDYISVSAGGGTALVPIGAIGATEGLVITPVIATFASTPATPSATVVFTVINASDAAIDSPTFYLDGDDVADFDFGNGSCFTLPVLAPVSSCTVAIVFSPTPADTPDRRARFTVSATGNNADGTVATLIGTVYSGTDR